MMNPEILQQLPALNIYNMNLPLDTWIQAIRITYRWSRSEERMQTKQKDIFIRIGHKTFSNGDRYSDGSFRRAYRMEIRGSDEKYVFKVFLNPSTGLDKVYDSVRILHEAQRFADGFNQHSPKSISFVNPAIILFPHLGHVPATMEPYLTGEYVKHTNNYEYVNMDKFNRPKNYTPHAFSHYCYEVTGGRKMVVDLQGISGMWTDPAIHSKDNDGSSGNLGEEGMKSFFRSHVCNPICESLGLKNRHRHRLKLEEDSKHTRVDHRVLVLAPPLSSTRPKAPIRNNPVVTPAVTVRPSPVRPSHDLVTLVSSYNQTTAQSEEVIYPGKVRINSLRGMPVLYQGNELGALQWLDSQQFSDSYDFHLPDGECEYLNTPFGRCCMQTTYYKYDSSKINQTTLYDRRVKYLQKKGSL